MKDFSKKNDKDAMSHPEYLNTEVASRSGYLKTTAVSTAILSLSVLSTALILMLSACGGAQNSGGSTESSSAVSSSAESGSAVGEAGGNEASNASSDSVESEETQEGEAETIAEDDPDLVALDKITLGKKPDLKDMGSITLPDFKEIEVTVQKPQEVTEQQVDQVITGLLGLEPEIVSEPAKLGDIVNIDYAGSIDGKSFVGGTSQGYSLTLGSHSFIDTFEDQLIGFKAGDKTTVKVKFPDKYPSEEVAGKEAEFAVTINFVSRNPEPTDEDVKAYENTDAKTVAELRKEQREKLEQVAEYDYHSFIRQSAYSELLDKTKFELSEALLEYGKAYVVDWYRKNVLEPYSITFAGYANSMGVSKGDFLASLDEDMETCAKETFMMQKIIDDQGIKLTDKLIEDLAAEYSLMEEIDYDKEMLISELGEEEMEDQALNNAVLAWLETQITIKEE